LVDACDSELASLTKAARTLPVLSLKSARMSWSVVHRRPPSEDACTKIKPLFDSCRRCRSHAHGLWHEGDSTHGFTEAFRSQPDLFAPALRAWARNRTRFSPHSPPTSITSASAS